MQLDKMLYFIGHAGFYIRCGDYNIFIDPFKVGPNVKEKADLVLITHTHFDHCSKDDIKRVLKHDGEVICPSGCGEMAELKNFTLSEPGFKTTFKEARISAVPAYNIKPDRVSFHPKENKWVGYVVDVNGVKIYHAGDTDAIEEMKRLNGMGINAALLPIGGTYVMDVNEAAEAARMINAQYTIPMHYKNLLGKEKSAEAEGRFKKKVESALIMKEVQEPSYGFK